MLSIIDIKDYIDLDFETIEVVKKATRLPIEESIVLARQCLDTDHGRSLLHHMFLDQIADAAASYERALEAELRRAYRHFTRKYPLFAQ